MIDPNDSNELFYFAYGSNCHSRTFRWKFDRFQFNKNILAYGNYYADKLLLSNCLRIAVMFALNTLMENEVGISCVQSR